MKILGRDPFALGLTLGMVLFATVSARSAAPAGPQPQLPSPQPVLASHKALYTVTMTNARSGGEYLDVSGKMLLQFTDACDGWTTSQKSLLRSLLADGTEELSNSDFTSWESKGGDSYTFSVKQVDGNDVTEFRGRAKRLGANGAGVAEYTKPERKSYQLPPHFFFQTAQQIKLLEIANKGERFFNGQMFDGSEGGGASQFNAVILKSAIPVKLGIKSTLLDSPSHRVRIAFYSPEGVTPTGSDGNKAAADTGEQPEYEMTMTVHDNGVVSDYDYQYEEFSIHGQLEAIQPMPTPHC
ncbi:MAG TPA: DUF1849 family protein [Alphaproteobacteria bacterium]|nr:DUF1849 family protein [Alphaproteobacteria bacterium]